MKSWDTVTIVGVGLIGGSVGLALRKRGLARNIVGVGRNQTKLRRARRQGAITAATQDVERGVSNADVVVICTPVELITSFAERAARACPAGSLVTDAGSTKSNIVASVQPRWPGEVGFVGSHPLAGSEKSGCEHGQANLFEDRVTVVTPTPKTSEKHLKKAVQFWNSLGSVVVQMSPRQHDRAIAMTSHLPHVVASVLAASAGKEHLSLVASGWLDTTRIASGDVELWKQILTDNQPQVLKAIDKFEKTLHSFRRALQSGRRQTVARILAKGKENRDSLGN